MEETSKESFRRISWRMMRFTWRTSSRSENELSIYALVLKALELLMKHLGLAAPETHQHVHQHVRFTPEQFDRMSDDQLDRAEAAYRALATLEREVAADEARRAQFGRNLPA